MSWACRLVGACIFRFSVYSAMNIVKHSIQRTPSFSSSGYEGLINNI
jgi:hypothetical protein